MCSSVVIKLFHSCSLSLLCVFGGTVQRRKICWRKCRNSSAACPTLLTGRTRDSVTRWDQRFADNCISIMCFVRNTSNMWKRCTYVHRKCTKISKTSAKNVLYSVSCFLGKAICIQTLKCVVSIYWITSISGMFCVDPTRSLLYTWLRPTGWWIFYYLWYLTIMRIRTRSKNATPRARHWMKMQRR